MQQLQPPPFVGKLIHGFRSRGRSSALREEFLDTTDQTDIDDLFDYLRDICFRLGLGNPGDYSIFLDLLKLGIFFTRTRFQILLTAIQYIQQGILSGRQSVDTIGEIRIGITKFLHNNVIHDPISFLFSCLDVNDQFHRNLGLDNSGRTPNSQATTTSMTQIKQLLDAICRPVFGKAKDATTTNDTKEQEGRYAVLDLVPGLLTTLSSLEAVENPPNPEEPSPAPVGLAPKSSAYVDELLAEDWSDDATPIIFSMLSEIPLTPQQCSDLQSKLLSHIQSTLKDPTQYASMTKQVLTLTDKYQDVSWIPPLLLLLKKVPHRELATSMLVVELAIKQTSSTGNVILSYFTDFLNASSGQQEQSKTKKKKSKLEHTDTIFWVQHLLLLFLASMKEALQEKALNTISSIFAKMLSQNPNDARTKMFLEGLLGEFIRLNGMEQRSQALVETAFFLASFPVRRNKPLSQAIHNLAQHALVEIFGVYEVCRNEILMKCFNILVHDPSTAVKSLHCNILDAIARKHLVLLTQHVSKIQDWISYVIHFPLDISKKLIAAFTPLIKLSPPFLDSASMLFRKLVASKQNQSRTIGIFGMTRLLVDSNLESSRSASSYNNLHENIQLEVIAAMKPCFSFPLDVRSELYSALISVLSSANRGNRLSVDGIRVLIEIMWPRFHRFLEYHKSEKARRKHLLESGNPLLKKDYFYTLNVLKCFEDVAEELTPRPRESLALCIACLFHLVEASHDDSHSFQDDILIAVKSLLHQLTAYKSFVELVYGDLNDSNSQSNNEGSSKEDDAQKVKEVLLRELDEMDDSADEKEDVLPREFRLAAFPECKPERITAQMRLDFIKPFYLVCAQQFEESELFRKLFGDLELNSLQMFEMYALIESYISFTPANANQQFLSLISFPSICRFIDQFIEYHVQKTSVNRDLIPSIEAATYGLELMYHHFVAITQSPTEDDPEILFQMFERSMKLFVLEVLKLEDLEKNKNPYRDQLAEISGNVSQQIPLLPYYLKDFTLKILHTALTAILKDNPPSKQQLDDFRALVEHSNVVSAFMSKQLSSASSQDKEEESEEDAKQIKKKKKEKRSKSKSKKQAHSSDEESEEKPKKKNKSKKTKSVSRFSISVMEPSHLAFVFAKQLYREVSTGLPEFLMRTYMLLIDMLTARPKKPEEDEDEEEDNDPRSQIVHLFESILSEQAIRQTTLVKLLLKYILEHSQVKTGLAIATRSLKQCLDSTAEDDDNDMNEEEEDNNEENGHRGQLKLSSNKACKNATLLTVLNHYHSCLTSSTISQEGLLVANYILDGVEGLLSQEVATLTRPVIQRLLGVLAKLFKVFTAECKHALRGASKEMSDIFVVQSSLQQLQRLKQLCIDFRDWSDGNSEQLPTAVAKKIASVVLRMETFNLALDNLIAENSAHKSFKPIAKKFRKLDEKLKERVLDEDENNNNLDVHKLKKSMQQKKRKGRSNNTFVDAMMQEANYRGDNFADLEDFIVTKKGRQYDRFLSGETEE